MEFASIFPHVFGVWFFPKKKKKKRSVEWEFGQSPFLLSFLIGCCCSSSACSHHPFHRHANSPSSLVRLVARCRSLWLGKLGVKENKARTRRGFALVWSVACKKKKKPNQTKVFYLAPFCVCGDSGVLLCFLCFATHHQQTPPTPTTIFPNNNNHHTLSVLCCSLRPKKISQRVCLSVLISLQSSLFPTPPTPSSSHSLSVSVCLCLSLCLSLSVSLLFHIHAHGHQSTISKRRTGPQHFKLTP